MNLLLSALVAFLFWGHALTLAQPNLCREVDTKDELLFSNRVRLDSSYSYDDSVTIRVTRNQYANGLLDTIFTEDGPLAVSRPSANVVRASGNLGTANQYSETVFFSSMGRIDSMHRGFNNSSPSRTLFAYTDSTLVRKSLVNQTVIATDSITYGSNTRIVHFSNSIGFDRWDYCLAQMDSCRCFQDSTHTKPGSYYTFKKGKLKAFHKSTGEKINEYFWADDIITIRSRSNNSNPSQILFPYEGYRLDGRRIKNPGKIEP